MICSLRFFGLNARKKIRQPLLSLHKVAHVTNFIVTVFSLGNKVSLDETPPFTSCLGSDWFIQLHLYSSDNFGMPQA